MYIDSIPLETGKRSPLLHLEKKGETVAFHIFFIPINHNPSTYTLSVIRGNPFPWLYLILLLAWKIVVISFTLYLKILMVPERSLFSYWRYKILPGLKFHLPLFKHMLSLFTPFNPLKSLNANSPIYSLIKFPNTLTLQSHGFQISLSIM